MPAYDQAARERILREVKRSPTPEADVTATCSLSTIRQALHAASDGLPRVSTFTLWRVLHEAGYSHPNTRTWCPTGTPLRRRKAGAAVVADADLDPKKVDRGRLPARRSDGPSGLVQRPGRSVPDDAPPGPDLTAGGQAGSPGPRVSSRRHVQNPDALPSG